MQSVNALGNTVKSRAQMMCMTLVLVCTQCSGHRLLMRCSCFTCAVLICQSALNRQISCKLYCHEVKGSFPEVLCAAKSCKVE